MFISELPRRLHQELVRELLEVFHQVFHLELGTRWECPSCSLDSWLDRCLGNFQVGIDPGCSSRVGTGLESNSFRLSQK